MKDDDREDRTLRAAKRSQHREEIFSIFRVLISVTIAMIISFIIIMVVSKEPVISLKAFITGPCSSTRRMGNVVEAAIPLIFTGLAASVMFQAKQFSLIGDGAFFLGALATSAFAIHTTMPFVIHPFLALIVGAVTGGICGFVPGFLKAKWDINEFVTSMMLNYILALLGLYFLLYFIRDPKSGFIASFPIMNSAKLARLVTGTKIHAGLLIALLTIAVMCVFLYKTRWGFAIRMTGINKKFAEYSGINTFRVLVLCQVLGGSLAGIGGAIEILGMYERFQWQVSPGLGFDGVTVAILAGNNPALVLVSAFFLAFLRTGTEIMARESEVPYEAVYVVQGIVMLMVTASTLFSTFHHRLVLNSNRGISDTEA